MSGLFDRPSSVTSLDVLRNLRAKLEVYAPEERLAALRREAAERAGLFPDVGDVVASVLCVVLAAPGMDVLDVVDGLIVIERAGGAR